MIKQVDSTVGHLRRQIALANLTNRVNLIVVSDHGIYMILILHYL